MEEITGYEINYCLFTCPHCMEQNEIAYEDLDELPCTVTCARCDKPYKLVEIICQ